MLYSEHALPVISDIHGNHEGLKQVLAHIEMLGIQRPPLYLGDYLYNEWEPYDPDQVIHLMIDKPATGRILGNTDRWITENLLEEMKLDDPIDQAAQQKLLQWKRNNMFKPTNLEFLREATPHKVIKMGDHRILATHASPLNDEDGILPFLSQELVQKRLDGFQGSAIITGHLHKAFTRMIGEKVHFSIGAVGKHPKEYDGVIEYGIIDLTCTGLICHHISLVQRNEPEIIRHSDL